MHIGIMSGHFRRPSLGESLDAILGHGIRHLQFNLGSAHLDGPPGEQDESVFAGIRDDVAAAVSHLRASDPDREVFTLGFCFGGSASWHQAANGLQLSGAIGFYGKPRRPEETAGAIDRVAGMACPILALMGGDDPSIPLEAVRGLEDALAGAGVPHEVVVYPGAPHSFFDRRYQEFAGESNDAWERVLAFIAANSSRGGT